MRTVSKLFIVSLVIGALALVGCSSSDTAVSDVAPVAPAPAAAAAAAAAPAGTGGGAAAAGAGSATQNQGQGNARGNGTRDFDPQHGESYPIPFFLLTHETYGGTGSSVLEGVSYRLIIIEYRLCYSYGFLRARQ